jgi:hypothetical protein
MSARKSPPQNRRGPKPSVEKADVFLNIPYDERFEKLLFAYIAGISAFGFVPRATLEIPFSQRRLERIISLIASSRYSVHDLSRVQLDRTAPSTPRFNMPFELGITVGLGNAKHSWIVCETVRRRINKSLSDLDGTDVYIHGGTVRGVFRELCNAFVQESAPAERRADDADLPDTPVEVCEYSAKRGSQRPVQRARLSGSMRARERRS